tara:strand:- start:119 stop:739 length:621 start_codon:yes stop_codon:yes gene_type:complete
MTKKGFRNPIPANPVYSKLLFQVANCGGVYASDEKFLKIAGKRRVNVTLQLQHLYKEGYLTKKVEGVGNRTIYWIKWDKIISEFFDVLEEKKKSIMAVVGKMEDYAYVHKYYSLLGKLDSDYIKRMQHNESMIGFFDLSLGDYGGLPFEATLNELYEQMILALATLERDKLKNQDFKLLTKICGKLILHPAGYVIASRTPNTLSLL